MRYCQACQRCFGDRVDYCLIDQSPTRLVPSIPLVIDHKYRLERLIAHGGMGSVYRACHLSLDRPVAIKILRHEYLEDTTIRERFSREAKAVARLRHPNVISIYDYGLLPGDRADQCGAYLVMELVEGQNLRQWIRGGAFRDGIHGLARTASVLTQICAGVDAAHRQGIIHRDLKPDNIMIEESPNNPERVLVLDFGIAKLKDRELVWQGLTDEDMVIGTPNYISPEQCSGLDIDHRSDIYSLGVMLFEMLTSSTPFAAPNTSTILLRHMQETPPPVGRFRTDLNDEIERVVTRALEKNPDHRFESAAGLAIEYNLGVEQILRSVENEVTQGEPSARQANIAGHINDNEVIFSTPATLVRGARRRGMFSFAIFASVLAILTTGVYLGPSTARNSVEGVQKTVAKVSERPGRPPGSEIPEKAVRPSAAGDISDVTVRELRSVYNEWSVSAIRGDWKRHIGLYGNRVDYFRDGNLPRSKVEARKRRIFAGVDSFELKFSDVPSIRYRKNGEVQLADLTFQRRWRLRRGKKRVDGRARGMLTLRRDPAGWRIIGEKQIGK